MRYFHKLGKNVKYIRGGNVKVISYLLTLNLSSTDVLLIYILGPHRLPLPSYLLFNIICTSSKKHTTEQITILALVAQRQYHTRRTADRLLFTHSHRSLL